MLGRSLSLVLTMSLSHFAHSSDIDDVSACAGVIAGDAYVDLSIGINEDLFDDTFTYALSLQIAVLDGASDEDRVFSDRVFASNLDKMVGLLNAEAYDADAMQEVITCYRILAPMSRKYLLQLMRTREVLEQIAPQKIAIARRMLKAGA